METTRREFLKLVTAAVGAAALPSFLSLGTELEFEAVIDEDLLTAALSIGKVVKDNIVVNVDVDKLWEGMYLVDQRHRVWRTQDQGQTWTCGDLWFNTEGECSWA